MMAQRRGDGAKPSENTKNARERAAIKRTQEQIRAMLNDPAFPIPTEYLVEELERRYCNFIVAGLNWNGSKGTGEILVHIGGCAEDDTGMGMLLSGIFGEHKDRIDEDTEPGPPTP